jgi:hypothetical protein
MSFVKRVVNLLKVDNPEATTIHVVGRLGFLANAANQQRRL